MIGRFILHVDFNSYFATVEQQANPRLRGKPVGVTGGDRLERTVIGAASVEAKKYGVKTGMAIWEAKKLCPQIVFIRGDSEKYLECTKRFLNILKNYTPYVELFSIDEAFLEIPTSVISNECERSPGFESADFSLSARNDNILESRLLTLAIDIKSRIRSEIGEWMTCSIGISYNKLMAKLAGSLQKPNGLVIIPNQVKAIEVLDKIELDGICGIGPRIKKRLWGMGIFNFRQLRKVPLETLTLSFKSYGKFLYDIARGEDFSPVTPFHTKGEVGSIGHRHTLIFNTGALSRIKPVILKLTELISRRLRAKKLTGKTVVCYWRRADFQGDCIQTTIPYTDNGFTIFQAAWRIFLAIWQREPIRMVGVSVSGLRPKTPQNLSVLPNIQKDAQIIQAIDTINDKFGEFTLQRAVLLESEKVYRKPNPYLSDRRFKL